MPYTLMKKKGKVQLKEKKPRKDKEMKERHQYMKDMWTHHPAMAKKHSKDELHSFAIGLEGSPDLKHAKRVAKYLGTIHHEIKYTVQEGIDALPDVIKHIETFDVTTIRASTPMYLLARKIKSLGIKMVLSGEGADELFGGYLYFHMAPDKEEFHKETVRKLSMLSKLFKRINMICH